MYRESVLFSRTKAKEFGPKGVHVYLVSISVSLILGVECLYSRRGFGGIPGVGLMAKNHLSGFHGHNHHD